MTAPRGRLQLKCSFKPDTARLAIELVAADQLIGSSQDPGNLSHPFVTLQLRADNGSGKTKVFSEARSKTAKDTLAPVFNEKFVFDLTPALMSGLETRLYIKIRDHDRFKRDEFMGCMSFALDELATTRPPSGWFLLLDKGLGHTSNAPYTQQRVATDHTKDVVRRRSLVLWGKEIPVDVYSSLPHREVQRQQAIFELISTEKTYQNDLEHVLSVYSRHNCGKTLTDQEYTEFLCPLQHLLDLGRPFLDDLLALQEAAGEGVVEAIGGTVKYHLPTFEQQYTSFCVRSEEVRWMLNTKASETPAFARLLKAGSEMCGMLSLQSYLLKPMQRLTKYPLLLREIHHNTSPDHPDLHDIETAWTETAAMVSRIDQQVQDEEMRKQLLHIAECTVVPDAFSDTDLQAPGIRLRKTGVFTRVKVRRGSGMHSLPELKSTALKVASEGKRRICLLEDIVTGPFIIISQVLPGTSAKEVQLTPKVPLASIKMRANADAQEIDLALVTPWVQGKPQHQAVFKANTSKEVHDWISSLSSLQEESVQSNLSHDALEQVQKAGRELRTKSGVSLSSADRQLLLATQLVEGLSRKLRRLSQVDSRAQALTASPPCSPCQSDAIVEDGNGEDSDYSASPLVSRNSTLLSRHGSSMSRGSSPNQAALGLQPRSASLASQPAGWERRSSSQLGSSAQRQVSFEPETSVGSVGSDSGDPLADAVDTFCKCQRILDVARSAHTMAMEHMLRVAGSAPGSTTTGSSSRKASASSIVSNGRGQGEGRTAALAASAGGSSATGLFVSQHSAEAATRGLLEPAGGAVRMALRRESHATRAVIWAHLADHPLNPCRDADELGSLLRLDGKRRSGSAKVGLGCWCAMWVAVSVVMGRPLCCRRG
eukprot:m.256267 g.256267  ORF g.256267 m.256267 type:complete len:881 (-) comp19170_c0_seq8:148-2790(-)